MELFEEVFPEANPDHDLKTSNAKEATKISSVKKIRVAMCRYDKCQQTFASQPCASAMTWTRSIDESEIDYKGYSLSEALINKEVHVLFLQSKQSAAPSLKLFTH